MVPVRAANNRAKKPHLNQTKGSVRFTIANSPPHPTMISRIEGITNDLKL